MLLLKPDQIEVNGNRIVSRERSPAIWTGPQPEVFARPSDVRRSEIERISWVESASVQRILRTACASSDGAHSRRLLPRNGNQLALIDARA